MGSTEQELSFEKNTSLKRRKKRGLLYDYWKYRHLFYLMIPGLIYYLVFKYGPLYGIQLAFKKYNFRAGIRGSEWVGLDNFRSLLRMESFAEVFRNTIIISTYKLLFGFPAPIILALLLNEIRNNRFKKTVQTISYLPHFLSWVVLAGIFTQFLSPSIGPINIFLKSLGAKPIYFLGDENWFRTVLVVTSIWKSVGWGSIVYLAALSNINTELYEAATIDGAGRWKQACYITLPGLFPIITIMLILAVGRIIDDDFSQIFNMYNPAVYSVGDVISTYTYRRGLVSMEYGFATAVSLFKNIISLVLIIITNSISRKINDYGLW